MIAAPSATAATEIPSTAPSPSQVDPRGASRGAAFVVGAAVPVPVEPVPVEPVSLGAVLPAAKSDEWCRSVTISAYAMPASADFLLAFKVLDFVVTE